ncbi:MAG: hypothetical protein U0Q11_14395 [Vicinamibacterales bacterium]
MSWTEDRHRQPHFERAQIWRAAREAVCEVGRLAIWHTAGRAVNRRDIVQRLVWVATS